MVRSSTPACPRSLERAALAAAFALAAGALWLVVAHAALPPPILPLAGGEAAYTVCPAGPPTCDFSTIQAAIDAASAGDTVKVAAATYTDLHARPSPAGYPGPEVITQVAYLDESITLRGGYSADDGFAEPPDPQANPTILDAQGGGRALFVGGAGPVVEGLRLTGGDAAGLGGDLFADQAGGGAYVYSATATLSHVELTANSAGAAGAGGGLAFYRSPSTLRRSTLTANSAGLNGGAIYLWLSPAQIEDNLISANTVITFGGGLSVVASHGATLERNRIRYNSAGYGGGIYFDSSDVVCRGNLVEGNNATAAGGIYYSYTGWINPSSLLSNTIAHNTAALGGGLVLIYAPGTIAGNTIAHNTAGSGGGLYMFSSDTLFENNTFHANVASGEGGAMLVECSSATVLANRFSENQAQIGGALRLDGSPSLLEANSFLFNNATRGAALYLVDSDARLVNNLLAGNVASETGSALCAAGSSPLLIHTTLAGNSGGDGSGIHLTHSDSWPSAAVLTNTILVSQPVGLLVETGCSVSAEATLWGNGVDWAGDGLILTGTVNLWGDPDFVDPANGDYHIGAASAALDAGLAVPVGTDIDGDARPQGPGPDLGADERLVVGPAMHVAGIRMRAFDLGGRVLIRATVHIVDQDGLDVPEAVVAVEWTRPDGSTRVQQATTTARGLGFFSLRSAQSGSFQVCVTAVEKPGWSYDPDQNAETCDTQDVP